MKVIGEEGTSLPDFTTYLKSTYLDVTYLQQDAFHDIDAATSMDRQRYVFRKIVEVLKVRMKFQDKEEARTFFHRLSRTTREWNRVPMNEVQFKTMEQDIEDMLEEVTDYA